MNRSGTALLIKLRHCFNKRNGEEQDSENTATYIFLVIMAITKPDYQ